MHMKSFCRSMPVALFISVAIGSAIAHDSADAQDRPAAATQRLIPCIKGPNPAACTTEDLQQDLITMLWAGHKDDALQVIARLSDVNFVDRTGGFRPLSLATQQGQSEIVSALLRKDADPLTVDRHGQLVLYGDIGTVYSRGSDFPFEVLDVGDNDMQLSIEIQNASGARNDFTKERFELHYDATASREGSRYDA